MNEKIPLREIKKARTKIKLFHTALDIIGEKSFREVYVEELCDQVEISKVTFFKMFSRKEDILIYFMRLWLTDRMLELQETNKKGIAALRHIFEAVSNYAKEKPGRYTAQMDNSFVVFVIGMRINRLFSVSKWLPVARAMGGMLKELYENKELGFLGTESFFNGRTILQIQYWKSFEALEHYARHASTCRGMERFQPKSFKNENSWYFS